MASPVVVSPGDGSANSYCSRTFADIYHENRLHAGTWEDADAEIKDAALIMATRVIDQQFAWAGVRSSPGTQRLEWPRDGLLNDEGDLELDPAAIPERLQEATAEFARLLIESDTTVASGVAGGAITSLKAGSVQINYASGVVAQTDLVPDAVRFSLPRHWYVSIRSHAQTVVPLLTDIRRKIWEHSHRKDSRHGTMPRSALPLWPCLRRGTRAIQARQGPQNTQAPASRASPLRLAHVHQ